jgi:hypothetical protein
MENTWKVFSHIRRIREKYLSVLKNTTKLRLLEGHKIVSEYAESIETYSENKQKVLKHIWIKRQKNLGIFS